MMLLCSSAFAQTIPLEFDVTLKNQMNVNESPAGTFNITTLGPDPWIRPTTLTTEYNPDEVYVISFEYVAGQGLDNFQILYRQQGVPFKTVDFGPLAPASTFRTFKAFMKIEAGTWDQAYEFFRFDFGKQAGQTLKVRNVELRAPTATEVIPFTLDPGTQNQLASVEENSDGSFSIVTGGADPFIGSTTVATTYDPDKVYVLSFDYTSNSGIGPDFELFYGLPFAGTRKATYDSLAATASKQTFTTILKLDAPSWDDFYANFRFDLGRRVGQDITMSNFLLREPTNAEAAQVVIEETIDIELDVSTTSQFLTGTEVAPGSYVLNTTGNDPWIRSKQVTSLYNPDSTYILSYEYRAVEAYNELQVFFGPPITGLQSFTAPDALTAAPEWTTQTINTRLLVDNFQDNRWSTFRFDFGKNENVDKTIEIRNIKLRKPTYAELQAELTSDKFVSRAANADFIDYLATTFPNSVDLVSVDMEKVSLQGSVGGNAGAYFLAEVEPQFYGFSQTEFLNPTPLTLTDGKFTATFPRYAPRSDRNYDRLYSRWAVVTPDGSGGYVLASDLEWATDIIRIAENNLEEDKAATIKGIDGLTPQSLSMFDDLIDLDVKSMKINLLIQGIYSDRPTGMTHEFNGKTYDINPVFVGGLDDRMKILTDNGIKTSLVFLIPISSNNENIQRRFVHPDAYLGNYSMANVATEEGIEYYTAIIDFLAQRYSRPDKLYGRLDQWIIHNEVDAHTDWTHAGEKPVELYTQIYDRSMRMVHYTIRKYNPTAKVFGSFTKHWNSKPVSAANFRSKEILDILGQLSKKEGDYEWGIGWHSYPTNLANASVWNDPVGRTPLNFNASEITPRNLEMIDAYVRQESVLYNGKKVRTILLSENGFNSNPANAGSSETLQAAALAYFWKKADQRLPAVENIQLHRWVDFPTEGGILFGLWTTQPGTNGVFNEKKEGWYVWAAAGTNEEDAVLDPYKSIIGIDDWSEIQYQVPTETTPYRVLMNVSNCDASLSELLVSFNGEQKIPQDDGTVKFFNVASNVAQPYTITKGGILLASDTLYLDDDLELNLDLQAVANLTATGLSPTEIVLKWDGAAGATFVVERSDAGAPFTELGRTSGETTFTDATVVSGQEYAYRVAAVLDGETLSCYSDPAAITAPFILVDYLNGDYDKPYNQKITPVISLRNESDQPVAISELTVRYWFTADEITTDLILYVDGAIPFAEGVSGEFVPLDPVLDGADYYLELSYDTDYLIPANGATGEMRTKISGFKRPDFDETDDYSYLNIRDYVETRKITVYQNGELIWGDEPGVAAPLSGLAVEGTNASGEISTNAQPEAKLNSPLNEQAGFGSLSPNPAIDYADLSWNSDITTAEQVMLFDTRGVQLPFTKEVAANRLRIRFGDLPTGVYILSAHINGTPVTERLLIRR